MKPHRIPSDTLIGDVVTRSEKFPATECAWPRTVIYFASGRWLVLTDAGTAHSSAAFELR